MQLIRCVTIYYGNKEIWSKEACGKVHHSPLRCPLYPSKCQHTSQHVDCHQTVQKYTGSRFEMCVTCVQHNEGIKSNITDQRHKPT